MSNPNKIEFLRGKSKWANVIVPGKFAKWTIDLNLDNDSLTKVLAWKKEGIQNHITKDDDGYWVTISRPIKWKGRDGVEQPMAPPSVLNADNTVYTGTKIGNGSDVEVKVELRSFTVPISKQAGKAMRLVGVKIHDLVDFDIEDYEDPKQTKMASGFPDLIPWKETKE